MLPQGEDGFPFDNGVDDHGFEESESVLLLS